MIWFWLLLLYVIIGVGCAYYVKGDFDDSGLILVAMFWPVLAVILLFLILFDVIKDGL